MTACLTGAGRGPLNLPGARGQKIISGCCVKVILSCQSIPTRQKGSFRAGRVYVTTEEHKAIRWFLIHPLYPAKCHNLRSAINPVNLTSTEHDKQKINMIRGSIKERDSCDCLTRSDGLVRKHYISVCIEAIKGHKKENWSAISGTEPPWSDCKCTFPLVIRNTSRTFYGCVVHSTVSEKRVCGHSHYWATDPLPFYLNIHTWGCMYFKEPRRQRLIHNFESFQNPSVFVAVFKDYICSPCSVLLSCSLNTLWNTPGAMVTADVTKLNANIEIAFFFVSPLPYC